ncbi:hypothetical protein DB345_08505 [Spartobacteria bacterium LR76]|nr:hypothetical protein DB345_08505 [Spartobacteria bacterium LR76]
MKLRYLLAPLRRALLLLPLAALAACSSSSDTADSSAETPQPSGTLARKALLHNAPPPIKLLNAIGTVGQKIEKKSEKKSDTTVTTDTTDTTTPPQASQ